MPNPSPNSNQLGQTQDALGYIRRVAKKFDIEPESQLALYMATATAGGERDAAEALRLWTVAPASVKEAAAAVDFAQRQWPPAAEKAARAFLAVVTANGPPPAPSAPASP